MTDEITADRLEALYESAATMNRMQLTEAVFELVAEIRRLRELDEHATSFRIGKVKVFRGTTGWWACLESPAVKRLHDEPVSKADAIAMARKESDK